MMVSLAHASLSPNPNTLHYANSPSEAYPTTELDHHHHHDLYIHENGGGTSIKTETASPSPSVDPTEPPKKKQKRNKPTLSCEECVERKTKVSDHFLTYAISLPPRWSYSRYRRCTHHLQPHPIHFALCARRFTLCTFKLLSPASLLFCFAVSVSPSSPVACIMLVPTLPSRDLADRPATAQACCSRLSAQRICREGGTPASFPIFPFNIAALICLDAQHVSIRVFNLILDTTDWSSYSNFKRKFAFSGSKCLQSQWHSSLQHALFPEDFGALALFVAVETQPTTVRCIDPADMQPAIDRHQLAGSPLINPGCPLELVGGSAGLSLARTSGRSGLGETLLTCPVRALVRQRPPSLLSL
jgi:hypothetical protein